MVVNRFRVEDDEPERQMENYKAVLPRIISSESSRDAAESYINNADFQEKMILTRMLNDWNQETFSVENTNGVIRAEAVPVIKDWLNKADAEDVVCAKKLLTHLSKQKKQEDEVQTRNSPRSRQGSRQGTRNNKAAGSRQGSRPSTMASRSGRASADKPSKKDAPERPGIRPRTSITYGSYYPSQHIAGFGNNTSHFNIVRSQVRPKTTLTKAQQYRQKYGEKPQTERETFNPINRSSIFGNVVYPVPQETVGLDGGLSQRSRPTTQQNRPSTQQNRPKTQQSRPATQQKRPGTKQSRPGTQANDGMRRDSQLRKQWSDERIKFSANLQNSNEGKVSPIDISPEPAAEKQCDTCRKNATPQEEQPQVFYPGSESHRTIGLNKHWPGRSYQPTHNLLG